MRVERSLRTRAALVALLAALAPAACVQWEKNQVRRARAAYDHCVETHSHAHQDCQALHERLLAAEDRYERTVEEELACDPELEECPTPR